MEKSETAHIDLFGFREYDARWLYPKDINLEGIKNIGQGFGSQIIYKTMYLNFGRWIPAKQKFLLTKLKIENTKRENPICLQSIKVSDNRSHFIQVNGQSCLMYNE